MKFVFCSRSELGHVDIITIEVILVQSSLENLKIIQYSVTAGES